MEFYGDYHTHSHYSDAKQGVEDIVQVARNKGLREVAITDHGPLAAVIGVKNDEIYLKLRKIIDEMNIKYDDIIVLLGGEANIRDEKGTLDISPAVIAEMDILIAGLHPYTLPTSPKDGFKIFAQNSLRHLGKGQKAKAINNNTKACLAAIENNPRLDILSHPGLFFEVEVAEVARACAQHEVLFEINCGHEHPDISVIMEADKYGANFIVNSDAHFTKSVGNLEYGEKIIKKLNLGEERVANLLSRGGYTTWSKKTKTYTF